MPGIFAQTIVFAAATTAIGMTDDINKGIIDRFRSLPMARSAVLIGRSFADVIYNGGILIVLMVSGLAVGWGSTPASRSSSPASPCCCCSPSRCPGSASGSACPCPTVEVANQVVFTVIFPITFVSERLRAARARCRPGSSPFAEWNPMSTLTAALRELWGNPNPYATDGFPAEHPILVTLVWVVVIVAVFAPLGVRRYRTMSR